jgi:hypothetical protein
MATLRYAVSALRQSQVLWPLNVLGKGLLHRLLSTLMSLPTISGGSAGQVPPPVDMTVDKSVNQLLYITFIGKKVFEYYHC